MSLLHCKSLVRVASNLRVADRLQAEYRGNGKDPYLSSVDGSDDIIDVRQSEPHVRVSSYNNKNLIRMIIICAMGSAMLSATHGA